VEDLQQQNTLKEAQIEVRNIQIALSLALAGLVATAGTFYFTQYKSKKKASEQLESKNRLIENQNSVLIHQNKEKEALLAEVHHRVKNNLQVMISMINIKSRNADPQAVSVLNEVVNRIYVLGLIYEMLYKSSSLQAISLKEYLEKQLLLTFSTGDSSDLGGIRYTLEADDIQADVETAMNVGLIHNELLTNITKYAFPAGQTHRSVLIRLLKEGDTVTFCVHDNGTRLAWSPGKVEPSFGLRLVEQLVTSKLNGKLSMNYEGGLRVEVTFPFPVGNRS
jgi:two-component sensor histidine kinase